jgi:asparagine synthase (glutamine-hydrolysing)
MCGILAVFTKSGFRLPDDADARIDGALAAVSHRGPDARGKWIRKQRDVALGHVRLAILDLSPEGNQPFRSACGRYALVFNGEIFNYVELRGELEARGHEFRTSSDTEVLLAALIADGESAVKRLNGMWAFVFVDLQEGTAIVARDRWGVKPLFMWETEKQLVFASEAKSILAFSGRTFEPDMTSIGLYLKYSIGGEHSSSWFRGIDRFPQAHVAGVRWGGDRLDWRRSRYWNYPSERSSISEGAARERLMALLTDALRIRLRSDVPVGLSLSGGLDSATLAYLARERFSVSLEAYTAWFEPRGKSEFDRAERVARMFGHTMHGVPPTGPSSVVRDLADCIYHLDAGNSSPAIVPYLNLCRSARTTLTVLLEGQGADELLFGYSYMFPFGALQFVRNGKFGRALEAIRGELQSDGWSRTLQEWIRYASTKIYSNQHLRWASDAIVSSEAHGAQNTDLSQLSFGQNAAHEALVLRHRTGLTNLLQYGDAISMAASLETRCPFLDYRLVEFGFSIPLNLLLRDGQGKWLLRSSLRQTLPQDVVWPKRKDGFSNDTVPSLRKIVRSCPRVNSGAALAMQHGLFSGKVASPQWLESLPDGPFFRVVSTMLWFDVFFGPGRSRKIAG